MKLKTIYLTLAMSLPSYVNAYEPPTMGWSSWNTYGFQINEALIRAQTDAMVEKGLKDAGYKYINIDDGFFGGRDENGKLLIHPERFPNGLKQLVDYIHSKGLKAGIYSDAGENTCASYWGGDTIGIGVGLYGHDQQDIDMYFKELNFDFIKVDFCGGAPEHNIDRLDLPEEERYRAIHQAILNTGRTDVRLNVCRWAFPGTWVHDVATSWRMSGDIGNSWGSIKDIIHQNLYLSAFATEGKFNDMDMLEVGRALTEEEDKTHFGMWCIMSSPLLIGCDMTTISDRALALLSNTELIALNQDPLALQAYVAGRSNGGYILVKDIETLHGTKRAVALYNPSDSPIEMNLDFLDVELGGKVKMRDLFEKEDIGTFSGNYKITVPAHSTRIYKLEAEERYERNVYEGETAWLDAYQEIENNQAAKTGIFEEADFCSGGAKAGWLGYSEKNNIEWKNVYSNEGGKYTITIYGISGEDRYIDLQVNNGTPVRLTLNSGGWAIVGTVTAEITLNAGDNSIKLSNATNWMPDIDKMTIVKSGSLEIYKNKVKSLVEKINNISDEELNQTFIQQKKDLLKKTENIEQTAEAYRQIISGLEEGIEMLESVYPAYQAFTALNDSCNLCFANAVASEDLDEFYKTQSELKEEIDAATTVEEINNATKALENAAKKFLKSEGVNPKEDKMIDMTMLVNNPNFDGSNFGWSGIPTQAYGVGEFYNKTFNMYQTITNVKNGKYLLEVSALFRTGVNDGGEAYNNGTENITAKLYANTEEKAIASLYSVEYDNKNADVLECLNGYANSMYAAGRCFEQGHYRNQLEVNVTNNTLRFGIKNTSFYNDNWCCFDNFRLNYLGEDGETSINEINKADDEYTNVYSIDGRIIKSQVKIKDAVKGLEKGIYVINQKKVIVD